MSFIDNLLSRWGYSSLGDSKTHAQINAPAFARLTAANSKFNIPDGSLAGHQAELYRRLSWVQVAVRMVAQAVASVPLGVQQLRGEETTAISNHPFELLLRKPNPLLSRFELLENTAAFQLLTGNAYWWLNAPAPGMPPTELWLLPPHKVRPIPDGQLYIAGYEYRDGNRELVLPVDEVTHFTSFHPTNEFVGLSRIEALATVAVGDMKMQEWNTNYFGEENARLPGALAFAENTPDAEWQRLQDDVIRQHGGTKRSMMLLRGVGQGAVNWVNMGVPQKDMEFLAGRQFNREEVLQMFGVPMGLLSENATEANATVARATFSDFTLWPMLVRLAEKITNEVLPRYGDNLAAAFDDVRAGDQALELEQRRVWAGYRTLDELRAVDGLEPLPDGRGELLLVEVPKRLEQVDDPASDEATGEDAPLAAPEATPDGVKAYAADLKLWRKKALRCVAEKGLAVCAFESDAIPAALHNEIAAGLAGARDAAAVKAVFDRYATPAETVSLQDTLSGGAPPLRITERGQDGRSSSGGEVAELASAVREAAVALRGES